MSSKHNKLLARRLRPYVLLLSLLLYAFSAQAQESIKGTVKDQQNQLIPTVSIFIEGTNRGTMSDMDGRFSLQAKPGEVMVFSFVGFQDQKITVDTRSIYDIVLQVDQRNLDEVVVIGYGSIKKSDVTGTVASVKKESLETRATTNPAEALQGLVSGVNVQKYGGTAGSGVYVKIRGVNTFGNNEPLYIIDGFAGSISTVNPADIESMEVLKDGAAAAIYGSVAANGVIIVTTKSGQKDGIKIDFNAFLNSTSTANQLKMLDADGYRSVHKNMYTEYNKYADAQQQEKLPAFITAPGAHTNWQDEVFRTGLAQNYGLGVQGGQGGIKFALYGNYAKEKGIVIGNNFSQQNASAKVSFKKSIFDVDSKLSFVGSQNEQPKFQLREVYGISPLVPVFDANETYGYGLTNKNDLPSNNNPLADAHFKKKLIKGQDFTGNVSITAHFTSWLQFKTAYSYRSLNNQDIAHTPPYISNEKSRQEYPVHTELRSTWDEQILDNILSVNKMLGAHSLNGMVGTTVNAVSSNWNTVSVEGKTTNHSVVGGNLVSVERPAGFLDPNFETIGAGKGGTFTADGSKYQYNRASFFGRINYAYLDRYLVQVTLRYDGSSKFGSNSRWGSFPSVALGWKMEQEPFFPKDGLLSSLKLRASWGQLGNEAALGYYASNALITTGNNLSLGYVQGTGNNPWVGSIATGLENRSLQWEVTDSKNVGLDYTLLKGKITGSINYFYNVTDKLLITKKLAPSAGLDDPILNVGKVSNSGFELEINFREQIQKVQFNVGFNISTLKNKVVNLSSDKQAINGEGLKFGTEHFPTQARIGKPISSFYLYRTDGIFQSIDEVNAHQHNGNLIQANAKPGDLRFKDLNGDGLIDDNDKEYAGTGLPKLEANLSFGAAYMGFDFSTLIGSAWGHHLYNGNKYFYQSMNSGGNMLASTLDAWRADRPSNIPRAVLQDPNGNSRESDRFLENGNFVRLRQLQIGYSLPKKLLEKAKIEKLRFYLSAENLWTITNYEGLDPEFARASILDTGVDRFVYPFTKSFIFGVQFVF